MEEGLSRENEMRLWNVRYSPTPEEIARLTGQIRTGELRITREGRNTLVVTEGPATRFFEED